MSGVVLMYHRVADPRDDVYGLAVGRGEFEEHIEHLGKLGSVVPLADVLKPGRAGKVAITFDDGYEDNARTAAPLLSDAGLPATFFITTRTLGRRRFWWDRLAEAFRGEHPLPAGVDVEVRCRATWLALDDFEARTTSLLFLHRRLRPLTPNELEATVADLLDRLAVPAPVEDNRTMTVDQLRTMADLPFVEIGAHTRTHLQLCGQQSTLQHDEVVGSVEDVVALLGRPVTSFAYPFGSRSAVGELAPRLAREAGCDVACTTAHGAVTATTKPHLMPRINVGNWNEEEFATRVGRAMCGL